MAKDNNQITNTQKLEKFIAIFSGESFAENFIRILDDNFDPDNFWDAEGDDENFDEDLKQYQEQGIILQGTREFNPKIKELLLDLLFNEYHRGHDDQGIPYDYNHKNINSLHNALHNAHNEHPDPIVIGEDDCVNICQNFKINKFFENYENLYKLKEDIEELIGQVESPFGQDIKGDS